MTAQSRRYRIEGYFTPPPELPEPADPTPATDKGAQEDQQAITPALLTIEQAARYLNIGRSAMFALLAGDDPAIPSLRVGERQRRVRRVDLDAFIEKRLKEAQK